MAVAFHGECSRCHRTRRFANCTDQTDLEGATGRLCADCLKLADKRPRPPSAWWLMLLCLWPWGGALYAHRRIERYHKDLELWTHRKKLEAEAEVYADKAEARAEKERAEKEKRDRIDRAFDGIIDDE